MLRVVGDRPDIVVAHRKIDAAIAICVSDWAARSEIVPNSVRIIAPVRMIVIEILRPIADRRALAHGCLLRDMRPRPAKCRSLCGGPERSSVHCPYPVRGYHGYAKTGNPALRVMVGCDNSRAIYCRQSYTSCVGRLSDA